MKKQNNKLKLIHSNNKKGSDTIARLQKELKVIVEKIERNLNQKKHNQ